MTIRPDLTRDLIVELYRRFAPELVHIRPFERELDHIGRMYHGEERRILYLMVRYFRPEIVVEFSPHKGWSTLHTARALEDNSVGLIYSFELEADNVVVAQQVLKEWGLMHRARFFVGDVRRTLPPILKPMNRPVDFLFVDSDHSYSFGKWWLKQVLPAVKPGGVVHVHDVEYSYRYGWGALTLTHYGQGEYGPPPRQFLSPPRWQQWVWRGWNGRRLPACIRQTLVPDDVQQALSRPYYAPGVSVADLTSPHGPGEALAVKEHLDEYLGDFQWLSVMALIEDHTYRAQVATCGGGSVAA